MSLAKSKTSFITILIGISFLGLSLILSVLAILDVQSDFTERRAASDIKQLIEDLDGFLKDWKINFIDQKNSVIKQENSILRFKVESSLDKIMAYKEAQQLAPNVQKIRTVFPMHFLMSFPADNVTLKIIEDELENMERFLNERIQRKQADVASGLMTLLFLILVSIGFSILLILYSTSISIREYKNKTRLLNEVEQALSTRSKFLATISHEVRTPLNGIIGLSDLLAISATGDHKKWAETIHDSGKVLLRIINDILDFSKLESNHFVLEKAPFKFMNMVDRVISTLHNKAASKGLYLECEIDSNLPEYVTSDCDRLTQVLFNLVGNAIKFTKSGGVVLKAKKLMDENHPGKLRICFSVIDTGVGIAKEQKKNLFVPFKQFDNEVQNSEPGTGLGLSISQAIITSLGGEIKMVDNASGGSCFYFELEFQEFSSSLIKDRIQVEEKVVMAPKTPQFKNLKILVVEDNPTNQLIAQTMLAQIGANVTTSSNGLESLKILETSKFDLILMDCQMPVLDGYGASQKIKAMGLTTPILAMTANATEENREKCFKAGMEGVLTKPIVLQDLVNAVSNLRTHQVSASTLEDLASKIGYSPTSKVVVSYLKTLSELDSKVKQHIKDNDLNNLNRLGHKFKSSSLTIGASYLGEQCKQLEYAKSMEEACAVVDRILPTRKMVQSELFLWLESHKVTT